MAKRILALVLAAFTFAAALSGCDEEEAKATDSTADGTHVHAIADGDKYDTDDTNHYYTCATCGEYVTEKHEDELFFNVNGHYTSCKCHHSSGEFISHTLENGKCTVCGYTEDKDHTHNYTQCLNVADDHHLLFCDCGKEVKEDHSMSEWTYEEGYAGHISTCKCGEIKTESHKVDENNKCTVCGYQGHVCTFADVPETFDDEMHYYEWLDENCNLFSGATHYYDTEYSHDADCHYNICMYCDHKGNREEHSYSIDTNECICQKVRPESVGLEFDEYEGGYAVIGIGSCTDKEILIPSTHNGKPVVAIGVSAFERNASIEYVMIPDSVTTVRSGAFAGCTSLKYVVFPDGVRTISDNTFMGSTSLESIIARGVTEIEMYAFLGCRSFQGFSNNYFGDSYYIPSVTIGGCAFKDCTSIADDSLEFTDVQYIGTGAFRGCTTIKSVTFHCYSEPIILGGDSFAGCTSLNTVVFYGMMPEYFEVDTFSYCTSLQTLRLCYGEKDDFLELFAMSTVEEDIGLSWYDGCPDFEVEFMAMNNQTAVDELVESIRISELYEYIDENYWQ